MARPPHARHAPSGRPRNGRGAAVVAARWAQRLHAPRRSQRPPPPPPGSRPGGAVPRGPGNGRHRCRRSQPRRRPGPVRGRASPAAP
eukprot:6536325-Prymnesium_polylepis.1